MRVVEIFGSIDGEGKRTGQLATFIRLAGCNLRCGYCDTAYAFSGGEEMSISEIANKCGRIGYKNVTLTGGEPLIHKDAFELIKTLCRLGFYVNVETNGSIPLEDLIKWREHHHARVFFTVDYKTLSSGMNHEMCIEAFDYLDVQKDIVKCVVANEEDMDNALAFLDNVATGKFNIWFSPVFGQLEPYRIVEYVKAHNRQDITVQVQLHKIIWDPMKRGV